MTCGKVVRLVLLWLVFAAVAAGLGYPILNRYNPAEIDGVSDTASYGQIVRGEPGQSGRNSLRILQPMLGRPVYLLARRIAPGWNPTSAGLLFSSVLFIATSCLLIVVLAQVSSAPAGVAALAPWLFLGNFWVANSMVAGMVDAGECCFVLVLAWALWRRQWWLMLPLGVLGAATKETFVVLAAVFAAGWLVQNRPRPGWTPWITAVLMVFAGLATVTGIRWWILQQWFWPWEFAAAQSAQSPWLMRLSEVFLSPGLLLAWIWLLPLAAPSLAKVERAWLIASLAATGAALALAVYHGSGGQNISRVTFSMLGPAFAVAAAWTLIRLVAGDFAGITPGRAARPSG